MQNNLGIIRDALRENNPLSCKAGRSREMVTYIFKVLFMTETDGCLPTLLLEFQEGVFWKSLPRVWSSILQVQKLNFVHLFKATQVLRDFHAHKILKHKPICQSVFLFFIYIFVCNF